MIGIIGAMEEEVAALKSEMADAKVTEFASMTFYKGTLCGKDAVVVRSGIGKVNAAICAQILVDKFGVDTLINTGIAGSLDARISIVNISSVGGKYPDLSRMAYGISKSAINYLTQNIAVQYARQGVRCNAVMPGFIATDAAMQNMSEDFLKMFLKNVPLNRPGQPEDIANAVLFFASDMSSFITGETMPVAGGFGLPSPMYAMYQDMKSKG